MRRYVWLNQYADQFLPIVALVVLRVVVGLGDSFLRAVTRPKKDPMQARHIGAEPLLPAVLCLYACPHICIHNGLVAFPGRIPPNGPAERAK